MDYILCLLAMGIGIFFHVMQKVMSLRIKFKELGFAMIWKTFFEQEWDSLLVSVAVVCTYMLFLFICNLNKVVFTPWFDAWGMYVIALVLGYAGQRLAYKYLKTAEDVLEKKAELLKADG